MILNLDVQNQSGSDQNTRIRNPALDLVLEFLFSPRESFSRPGSSLSIYSPTKTPVRNRGTLNKSASLNGLNAMPPQGTKEIMCNLGMGKKIKVWVKSHDKSSELMQLGKYDSTTDTTVTQVSVF